MKKYPTYSLLGVKVNALTKNDLLEITEQEINQNNKTVISNHNLHSIYIYHHDEQMREFYRLPNYIHIDGMPIVWLGQLFRYPLTRENRLTSLDWLEPMFHKCAEKEWRVFFLGSEPGVPEKAAAYFKEKVPGLHLQTHHGFFTVNNEENEEVIHKINEFQPHLLMVGMGMPRQEKWIYDNIRQLKANTIWNLGAFMDYYAGVKPLPPRWMGKIGLEWLYRLYSEPTRLWKRYCIEPIFILKLALLEAIHRIKNTK